MSTIDPLTDPVPFVFRPMEYFRDYAEGIRVSRNTKRTSVLLPGFLRRWIDIAQEDIPRRGFRPSHNTDHVVSLALQYGVTRPTRDWGYPTGQFSEIAVCGQRASMDGEWGAWPPMNLDHERKVSSSRKVNLRMEESTRKAVDMYRRFLGLDSQSPVIRHFLALAFRWYSEDVYANNVRCEINRETQAYVDKLRKEFDNRLKRADEWGWLDD